MASESAREGAVRAQRWGAREARRAEERRRRIQKQAHLERAREHERSWGAILAREACASNRKVEIGYHREVRYVLAVSVSVLLFSCSTPPSRLEGAPTRAPDDAYETGGGLSWRVLVWRCDERNERIAMIQECGDGFAGCGAWKIDRTLCPLDAPGREVTRTPEERRIEARGRGRHPIPAGYGWR